MVEANRALPTGIVMEIFGVHYVAEGLAAYKSLQIAALLLCFTALVWFLAEIGLDACVTGSAVLVSLLAIQFHGHFDGYLGFNAQVEDLFILSAVSWALFARWLRNRKAWQFNASIGVYIVSLLSYEACYLSSFVHMLVAVQYGGWRNWRKAAPFLALTLVAFVGLAVARIAYPQTGTAVYRLSLGPDVYLTTLWNEAAASLPLMYLGYFHDQLFPPGVGFFDVVPWWLTASLVATAAAAAYRTLQCNARSSRSLLLPGLMGAFIWVQPALLVAAVPRYQSEIRPGYGYIFMVFQGFGAGLAIACAIAALLLVVPGPLRRSFISMTALVYATLLGASFITNERTLQNFEGERAALINLTAALHDGIMANVPNGSVLFIDSPAQLMHRQPSMEGDLDVFDNPRFFVRQWADRSVHLHDLDLPQLPVELDCHRDTCAAPPRWYALRDVPFDVRNGFTAAGRLRAVSQMIDGTGHPFIDQLRVHIRGDQLAGLTRWGNLKLVYGCVNGERSIDVTRPLSSALDASAAQAAASVRRGVTFDVGSSCMVDLDTVALIR